MRHRQIGVAVLACTYGVIVGWALTADYFRQKLDNSKATNSELRRLLYLESQHSLQFKAAANINMVEDNIIPDQEELDFNLEEYPRRNTTTNENVTDENEEARENLKQVVNRAIAEYGIDPSENITHMGSRTLEMNKTPPFVISKEKYAYDEEEGDEYDKITVTYYPSQRVVLDDDDEVMDDIPNIIGWRNLSQFGGESGDPDVVFIRNRRLRTDFEVVKDDESPLPLHVKYGMGREEFEVNKAAGLLRLRDEDL